VTTTTKYSDFWREQLVNELDDLGPTAFAKKHGAVAKDATPEGYTLKEYSEHQQDNYLREQLLNASRGQIYDYAKKRFGADGVEEQDQEMESEGVPFGGRRSFGAKGDPTDLNLWVLDRIMAGRDEAPNKNEATHMPHLRRCFKAGLLTVDGPTLRLTEKGKAMLADRRARRGDFADYPSEPAERVAASLGRSPSRNQKISIHDARGEGHARAGQGLPPLPRIRFESDEAHEAHIEEYEQRRAGMEKDLAHLGAFGADADKEVAAARKKLRATGVCVDDVFPTLSNLKIRMCVSRASGEAGPQIKDDRSVVTALEQTVPEIFLDSREHIICLILDRKHFVVGVHKVALGSVSEAIADPRSFFGPALVLSASAVIFVHNHPSGDPQPSQDDMVLTERLAAVGKILKVKLLDSVVVGTTQGGAHVHYSFVQNGRLSGSFS
jgi:hypothetical protein